MFAAWLNALAWSRKNAWHKAKEEDWILDGDIVGRWKKVGPLSFVRVFGAGHMVRPHFLPTHDMEALPFASLPNPTVMYL